MAKAFHDEYKKVSKKIGWNTQKLCKVEFEKLPKKNKQVMIGTCAKMLEWINNNQEDI